MSTQPKALRLADRLDLWGDQGDLLEAAAELRAALQAMLDYHDDVAKAADQRLLDAGYAALAKAGGSK